MRPAIVLCLLPSLALAQPVPPTPPDQQPTATPLQPGPVPTTPPPHEFPATPVIQSVLPNLLATATGVTIEVRLDYTDLDGADVSVLNAHAHGQYIAPQGYGGYIKIPFGYIGESDESLFGMGGAGLGNIEVGGLFLSKLSRETDLLLRAGIAIDTTSSDDDLAVVVSTVLPRLVDAYTSGLETTWGRAQAQVRKQSNNLRFGAALGIDMPIAGEVADQPGFNAIINGVGSVGVQNQNLGLGVSLVTVEIVSDGADDENYMGINLGADYLMNPNARITFGLGMSLEDNTDGLSFGIGTRGGF